MPNTELEKYQVDSPYDLSRYTCWSAVPTNGFKDVSFLLGEIPWLKELKGGEAAFLNETLAALQERLWLKKNGTRNRNQASVVFLPEQPNITHHSEFCQLGETHHVIEPKVTSFDTKEWVTENLTKENLGWDDNEGEKNAYVIGRIQDAKDLMNFILTTQRLKELGVQEITFLCPYLAWTRQDRVNEEKGQPETIAAVMEIIARQVDRMATMDAHSIETARLGLKDKLAFCSFSGWKYLLETLKSEDYPQEKLVVIGPDLGRYCLSARVAQALGVSLVSLCKQRDGRKVTIEPLNREQKSSLEGKHALIFDDVIASAGTTQRILETVRNEILSLTIIASHALFIDGAIERLSDPKIKRVVYTDSRDLEQNPPANDRFLKVSCVPPLAEFLRRDITGEFNPWQDSYFHDALLAV